MNRGTIVKISGPLVVAKGLPRARLNDVVRVGELKLIGEIIELHRDRAFIQVYEETSGLRPGEPVHSIEQPLSVVVGPGLIGSIYDGIQRPLGDLRKRDGDFIKRGTTSPRIDHDRLWSFKPIRKVGDKVVAGDVLGEVPETPLIVHRILVPHHIISGEVQEIASGEFTVDDVVAQIKTSRGLEPVTMAQDWPVRKARPYNRRHDPRLLLSTGQRVIDTFFPITKGGTACIPGPFGSGKTVVQHQIAKWADAEVIIFIGCGERGNEMTDVLHEFPQLIDPNSGRPLMERTILIANTSNMPVAAREASIYTGITLAEYYRDMGHHVAVMADSTSRWAEAMREMGARLEEMPGEEGYPAYLGSRVAEFYSRAGHVTCLGNDGRDGSVTLIGAVSPPGGDLADPVVQATLRAVKVFWGLDSRLAYERHFPAIDWLSSYSLYESAADSYLRDRFGDQPVDDRVLAMRLLEEENELMEIVRLVGIESLTPLQRVSIRTAQAVREDFLHQNAFVDEDSYTSLKKQTQLLRLIIHIYERSVEALENGVSFQDLIELTSWERLSDARYLQDDDMDSFELLRNEATNEISVLISGGGEDSSGNTDLSDAPGGVERKSATAEVNA